MGIFEFVKDAGERLVDSVRDITSGVTGPSSEQVSQALAARVTSLGISSQDLQVQFNDGVATILGTAPSQEEREKIILALGNVQGVSQVDDRLKVERPAPEATLYTVQRGDSLSKIAKAHYGDAQKYTVIFEANTPMLTDPNKIYPGQVLRIPPQA
jgi:nucleoid-associated protein YgaU